jgi:hypothetical protein
VDVDREITTTSPIQVEGTGEALRIMVPADSHLD